MRKQWYERINNGADVRCLTAGIADKLVSYAAQLGDTDFIEFIEAYWG